MEHDKNLLFGVFAVQLRKVTPARLMEVASAWAIDPARGIPERLIEAGAFTAEDRHMIQCLVDRAVEACGGDVARTLDHFGGDTLLKQTYRGSLYGQSTTPGDSPNPFDELADWTDFSPYNIGAVDESPGRYTLLSEYGRGGMGRVLMVRDGYLGREVALKELLPLAGGASTAPAVGATPDSHSVDLIVRFLQEARVTGQLEHPAIVPVYELGRRDDGTIYYTMKLVRGRTFSHAIHEADALRGRLKLLPHFVDLCQAIAYAHTRHVIHRDIKPSNIMLGEFGETVVLDWGLATHRGRRDIHSEGLEQTIRMLNLGEEVKAAQTHYGQVIGTPVYMPPEQARGELDRIDERSDVYSLGAVLYELLTGRPPFSGKSLREILQKVRSDFPTPVLELERGAPPELAAICHRAMSRIPDERYQSASELDQDIQRFLSGAFVSAHSYNLRQRVTRVAARNKAIVATLAASAIVLIAAAYMAMAQVRESNRASAWEAYKLTLVSAHQAIESGQHTRARSLLERSPETMRSWEWSVLGSMANAEVAVVETDAAMLAVNGGVTAPQAVFISESGLIHTVNLSTGQTVRILPTGSSVTAATVARNASAAAVAGPDGTVGLWDLNEGHQLDSMAVSASASGLPLAFSPDASFLAFAPASPHGTLARKALAESENVRSVRMGRSAIMHVAIAPSGARAAAAGSDGAIHLIDWASESAQAAAHAEPCVTGGLAFTPDGNFVLAVTPSELLRINAATGEPETRIEFAGKKALQATISGTHAAVIFGSSQSGPARDVTVYDSSTAIPVFNVPAREAENVYLAMDGRILALGMENATRIYGLEGDTGRDRVLEGSALGLVALEQSVWALTQPRGDRAAVWDATGRAIGSALPVPGPVTAIGFAPDGTVLVTGERDGNVRLWEGLRQTHAVTAHPQRPVQRVRFAPARNLMATAGGDLAVRVASLGSITIPVAEYRLPSDISALAFSPNGELLACGTRGYNAVTVWRVGEAGETFVSPVEFPPADIAFSPDNSIVAVSATHLSTAGYRDASTTAMRAWNITTALEVTPPADAAAWFMPSAGAGPLPSRRFDVGKGRVTVADAATGDELLVLPCSELAEGTDTTAWNESRHKWAFIDAEGNVVIWQ